MTLLTPHDALIFTMITMSAADRQISESELKRIADLIRNLPVFMGYDEDALAKAAETCGDVLSAEDGLETMLAMVTEALPKKLRETAYALALDVAAADLRIPDEEIRFLELLRDALSLDKLTTAALERGARARHQTL